MEPIEFTPIQLTCTVILAVLWGMYLGLYFERERNRADYIYFLRVKEETDKNESK